VFHGSKLLVVDDEPAVRDSLREILEQEGHEVVTAGSGEEALVVLSEQPIDLILLDLKMEGIDGLQVMEEAREIAPYTVIILLTAYGTLESAVAALRQGANDYLLKPCSVGEILASVEKGLGVRREAQRRNELVSSIEKTVRQLKDAPGSLEPEGEASQLWRFLRSKNLLLDREKQLAMAHGQPLRLTPTEFKLLAFFMQNVNRTLSYQELARKALAYDCSELEARNALKTHMWRLRKKLRDETGDDSCLVNVRGRGYIFSG
jgi:DNA-binding response OmpR family regulator